MNDRKVTPKRAVAITIVLLATLLFGLILRWAIKAMDEDRHTASAVRGMT